MRWSRALWIAATIVVLLPTISRIVSAAAPALIGLAVFATLVERLLRSPRRR